MLGATAAWAAPPGPNVSELVARGDQIFRRRHGAKDFWEAIHYYEEARKADPASHAALWRLARCYAGLADLASKQQRRDLGAKGLEYAQEATRVAPGRVEGWYFAATTFGLYASALGVVRAVREGAAGKFRGYIDKAVALDRGFDRAAPLIAYGRFLYELPWPMRDLDASLRYLSEARRRSPEKIRAALYLADVLLAKKQKDEARRELEACVAMDPAKEDAYDGRRAQAECRQRLASEGK